MLDNLKHKFTINLKKIELPLGILLSNKVNYLFLLILNILSALIFIYQPVVWGNIIDALTKSDFKLIVNGITVLFLVNISLNFLNNIQSYYATHINNKISYKIKSKLANAIFELPLFFFERKKTGDYISLMDGDVGVISSFLSSKLISHAMLFVKLIVIGFIIFRLNIMMSFFVIFCLLFIFISSFITSKKFKERNKELRKTSDAYFSQFQESLTGFKDIKSFQIEKVIQRKFTDRLRDYLSNYLKLSRTNTIVTMINSFFNEISIIGILAIGGYLISEKALSIGGFVTYSQYSMQFGLLLMGIGVINQDLMQLIISNNRVSEMFDCVDFEKRSEFVNENLKNEIEKGISIENLTFSYGNRIKVFDKLNFKVSPNSLVAFVGINGSGKTTLFNLLQRFYEIQGGRICIGDVDISRASHQNFREHISVVSQNPFFFNATIRENLTISKKNITEEEIIHYCKITNLWRYIESLPDGLDHIICEGAKNLSEGQKQRLAIVRALIKGSKIILFDEVTSSLDGESESYIRRALVNLSKSHTVLMIAHKLSTVLCADKIIVINNGKVVCEGDHLELIENCEVYQRLFGNEWDEYEQQLVIKSLAAHSN